MREIKFRVFDPCVPKDEGEAESGNHSGAMIHWDYVKQSSYLKDAIELNGAVYLMQYTGLKDKNGKEIYEGDILTAYDYVNYGNIKSVVKWIDNKCGFFPQEQEVNKFGGNYLSYWDQIQDIEVIGNIYENGEFASLNEVIL